MGRARRARRIAQVAAYGGGVGAAGLGALSLAGYGLMRAEAALARRIAGQPFDGSPDDEGVYGSGPGAPIRMLVLGDSTAAGLGADEPRQTIGAIVATGVAAFAGRQVELTNVAVVGAESGDLSEQLDRALTQLPHPDVAVVMIGANDVTGRVKASTAVGHLEEAVRRLRTAGSEVVVGTCPDFGAVGLIPQPLRLLARRWSRDLAAAQTVAVVEAGGRAVSIGDMLSEAFATDPTVMFSRDRFHPSAAGYARVAAALLPTVSAALDLFGETSAPAAPDSRRGEAVRPVAEAARHAVANPGTEVSPTVVGGSTRSQRGRWAELRHRLVPAILGGEGDDHTDPEPPPSEAEPSDTQTDPGAADRDSAHPRAPS